jgi:endonuclease YncB( thermonuclease family)
MLRQYMHKEQMKKILAVLLILPALAFAQKKEPQGVVYDAEILRVNDGDSIVISAPFLPPPLKPELIVRIYGVDTPEKGHRAKCALEDRKGTAATAFTKNAIANGQHHQVVLYAWDKFGGRVLGDILVDGVSLRAALIRNRLAREYYGEAKQSWC